MVSSRQVKRPPPSRARPQPAPVAANKLRAVQEAGDKTTLRADLVQALCECAFYVGMGNRSGVAVTLHRIGELWRQWPAPQAPERKS